MKLVRALLGAGILLIDRLTAPNPPRRDVEAQKGLDLKTSNLTLYHLTACPFCVKVRRQIRRQGLTIRLREIRRDRGADTELVAGGKLDQVPCLRIDDGERSEWLYESSAINTYLKTRFAD